MIIIEIKVVPSSGRSGWKLDKSGMLKCYLKSPAERGLANHELLTIIARLVKVPLANVSLVAGLTSRTKKVKIDAQISYPAFLKLAGIEPQMSVF